MTKKPNDEFPSTIPDIGVPADGLEPLNREVALPDGFRLPPFSDEAKAAMAAWQSVFKNITGERQDEGNGQ